MSATPNDVADLIDRLSEAAQRYATTNQVGAAGAFYGALIAVRDSLDARYAAARGSIGTAGLTVVPMITRGRRRES